MTHPTDLSDREFASFQRLIREAAGISLAPSKKALVAGRLAKRLKHHGIASFSDYHRLLDAQQGERQMAVDLLTTNETYFFREPKHFDFLRQQLLPRHPRERALRVWSAACSTGEEPYSVAMLLADHAGDSAWEILASDISTRVLDKARQAIYALGSVRGLAPEQMRRHCLKGTGSQEGCFAIDPALCRRVSFQQINLNTTLPEVGEFDLILLRNVLIYFEPQTKREVVARLQAKLRRGGHLFVGHSESLNGLADGLVQVVPAVYRKP
ncbi:CheR family methyltransferase [Aquabacterium sp.]|uniref:CheR family methyltransferase n=1 Tax=Aquabacterium sp. TaxID=1872578 RepID=UPI002CFABA4D|nr:protein-glutamate O-methyltransferase CheR [Aquabacterium sp.]HSW03983.1 protein-glutamate O-methyltransferase CheR [Aquabacterium sp.]